MDPERDGPDVGLWRRAYRSTPTVEGASCPGDEALAALVLDEIAGHERLRVADHVTGCPRCAEGYRLLVELHGGTVAASPGGLRHRAWRPSAAAAAVLVVAGALYLARPARDGDPLRGPSPTDAVAPAPDAMLGEPPADLSWRAEAGAVGYRVRLFDARGDLLWESDTSPLTSRRLTPDARRRLAPGAAYFWVVEIDGPAARPRLGPFWFQVKRDG